MASDPHSDGREESRHDDALVKAGVRGAPTLGGAGRYAGLGLQFVISILLFLWVGKWVDRQLGTDGPGVLVGVFVGAGAAFYSMYRSLMADQRREEQEAAAKRAAADTQDQR